MTNSKIIENKMHFNQYLFDVFKKLWQDPSKLARIFKQRYWMHFYWMARFGHKTDLHEKRWTLGNDISARKYSGYAEYAKHQASKIDDAVFRRHLESLEGEQYAGFVKRFSKAPELASRRTVICLGARLGTEVRAFIDMGFFAVGIDLNPGQGNKFVLSGDFHNLQFRDNSVDVVYTNVLDHAFDIQKVMSEVKRVLTPEGIAFLELIRGTDEGYLPQEYESLAWKTARGFAEHIAGLGALRLTAFRQNTEIDDPFWCQAVLQKSSA